MKYDILITHVPTPKAKNIIARHLAHTPSISMQKALSMLDNPPVVYLTNMTRQDAEFQIRQLDKIQVRATLAPIKTQTTIKSTVQEFVPDHILSTILEPEDKTASVEPLLSALPLVPAKRIRSQTDPRMNKFTNKKAGIFIGSGVLLCAIVFVLYMRSKDFDWNHAFSLDWTHSYLNVTDSAAKTTHESSKQTATTNGNDSEQAHGNSLTDSTSGEAPTQERIEQAQSFVDSAKKAMDRAHAVSFYKLAIAFNKHNVNAWQALRDAYAQGMMPADAEKTEQEMKRIFGDNVLSTSSIVGRFGEAKSMAATKDGVYRVEYQSAKSGREQLLLDAYLLSKSLQQSCGCNAVSLNIHTPGHAVMLVYSRMNNLPLNFNDFKSTAQVTWLE